MTKTPKKAPYSSSANPASQDHKTSPRPSTKPTSTPPSAAPLPSQQANTPSPHSTTPPSQLSTPSSKSTLKRTSGAPRTQVSTVHLKTTCLCGHTAGVKRHLVHGITFSRPAYYLSSVLHTRLRFPSSSPMWITTRHQMGLVTSPMPRSH